MDTGCSQTQPRDEGREELDRVVLETRMERIGRKILVLSGKGGVGKSTVAANLAISLARAGRKVGLLDVDLHGPSIPGILGLRDERLTSAPSGGIQPIRVSENLSVVSVGLLLDSATDAVIWRGPMKYNVIRQFLKDVEWGRLDNLVIDSPPGTGDEPLAVVQMVGAAWAIVVTTPQELAVADVRRSVSFCTTLNLRVAGVVENMSGLVCPHCGEVVDLFGAGGGRRLAEEMNVPFLGCVPLDPQIVASGDEGRPFAKSAGDGRASCAFASIVESMLHPSETSESGPAAEAADPQESQRMKIAIPVADGRLCMHFGHCEQFALVEVDEAAGTITNTSYLTPPPHEPGVLPRWLGEQGADVIIAGGMGQRAQALFARNGIRVVVGVTGGTPEEIATSYLGDALEVGPNACDH